MNKLAGLIVISLVVSLATSHSTNRDNYKDEPRLDLTDCDGLVEFRQIRAQIRSMKPQVTKIVNYILDGPGKNSTYNELAIFCDTFGPRLSGSKSLEAAIDYLSEKMANSQLDVTGETVMVPHWEVLSQSCGITKPVKHTMNILTLGNSVSTNGTLEAEVLLVHDFHELDVKGQAGELEGKIVVFNYKYTEYRQSVKYRTTGALKASKYGAAAALIRSVTGFSINSPHAGEGSKSIPTAAITVEDANLIERWVKRNKSVNIQLNIQTKHHGDAKSRNLIGDIRGKTRPDEIVFVSGHMDSWYNTPGAMDDGGGMMISYKALDILKKLDLKANRTMRVILWTAEEPGLVGAQQYFNKHKDKLDSFKVVIESDAGTFRPLGLSYKNMGSIGECVLQEILLLAPQVSTQAVNRRFEGSDIELFTDAGVPGVSLLNENSHYFDFHHTSGDTMDVEDPMSLDSATGLFASTLYVLANLDVDMRK